MGADRGILLSEVGFQSGAVEAANLTNVQVTSLSDLNVTAREQISAVRLRELYDRVEQSNARYWEIPKAKRIEDELRPDVGALGYSATSAIEACREVLARAFVGHYPFRYEELPAYYIPALQQAFNSTTQVVETVEGLVQELEAKLTASEAKGP